MEERRKTPEEYERIYLPMLEEDDRKKYTYVKHG